MKTSQLFFVFLLLLQLSCSEEKIVLDYCTMIAEDQLHVNQDKSDMDRFNADRKKRHKIFEKNFDLLMQKTRQDGFPFVSLQTYAADSCKYWAVTMTMLHTAQSDPAKFFSKKYARIFQAELNKGNIEKSLLEKSCTLTANTIALCEDLKPDIRRSVEMWGVDFAVFEVADFVKCD